MELLIREISDDYVRENFERIQRELQRGSVFDGFNSFEVAPSGAVTRMLYRHGLGYQPLDIVESYRFGPGEITWHRSDFTNEYLVYSTTDALRIRGLVGTFKRNGRGG